MGFINCYLVRKKLKNYIIINVVTKHDRNKRIAFFSAFLAGEGYNSPLWNSIVDECSKKGIDIVIFPNRLIKYELSQKNIYDQMFKMVNSDQFDGVILSTAALLSYFSKEDIYKKIEHFNNLPILSINHKLKGTINVDYNIDHGLSELLNHLIVDHGYRTFSYISGPITHPQCKRRLSIIKEKLLSYDITLHDRDIYFHNFTKVGIDDDLKGLIIDKSPKTEVVLCLNDTFAAYVIEFFNKNNIFVPGDVAVTGIDKTQHSWTTHPTITTIDSTVLKLGKECVDILEKSIETKTYQGNIFLKHDLVINESCGCHPKNSLEISNDIDNKVVEEYEPLFDKNRNHFITKIKSNITMFKDKSSLIKFYSSILYILNKKIEVSKNNSQIISINNLYSEIVELINDTNIKKIVKTEISDTQNLIVNRSNFEHIVTSKSLKELFVALKEFLTIYHVDTYYLLKYDDYDSSSFLEMVYGIQRGEELTVNINLDTSKYAFLPNEFIESDEQITYLTLPLHSLNRHYGFIIIKHTIGKTSDFYENLQMHLGNAIENIYFHNNLQRTKNLVIKSQKLAFLGNLVKGLTTAMDNPLKNISKNIRNYSSETRFLENNIETNKLTAIFLSDYLTTAESELFSIQVNIKHLIKLINKFKQISSSHDFDSIEKFNLLEKLNHSISTLKTNYSISNIAFNITCNENIIIDSYPGLFHKIFKILIKNSINHGFKNDQKGEININMKTWENMLIIQYYDSGVGVPYNELMNIMEPFYILEKNANKTGLGLTILHNIVINKLKGDIDLRLIDDKLHFILSLPLKLEVAKNVTS